MSIDVMKQALEALEFYYDLHEEDADSKVIATLRAAIEQAQKPVAWMCADEQMAHRGYSRFSRTCAGDWNIPVYTAPRQWQGLTEAEIDALMPVADGSAETDAIPVEVSPGIWGKEYYEVDAWSRPLVIELARAIEAKLRQKNA